METYLAAREESYWIPVTAASPQDAAKEFASTRADLVGKYDFEIWTATKLKPEFNAKTYLENYSEDNPESSPVEEDWANYVGEQEVNSLQALFEDWASKQKPFFMAKDRVGYFDKEGNPLNGVV